MDFDVVLTTYSVLEYTYRKVVNEHKVACKYCGRKLLPRSLIWHNKYFCGERIIKYINYDLLQFLRSGFYENCKTIKEGKV